MGIRARTLEFSSSRSSKATFLGTGVVGDWCCDTEFPAWLSVGAEYTSAVEECGFCMACIVGRSEGLADCCSTECCIISLLICVRKRSGGLCVSKRASSL